MSASLRAETASSPKLPSPSMPAPPPGQDLAHDVRHGLAATQKHLPSAWFYDEEGSRLFQRIMALPQYYLTRTEWDILRQRGADLARWIAPQGQAVDLIELGSGDGEKTLTLCQALQAHAPGSTYHPLDLSAVALDDLRQRFARELPQMTVHPVTGDYFKLWPRLPAGRRQVAMLLGSNLGNFTQPEAVALLQRVREQLRPGDALLLGLDLMKDPQVILDAYDDPQGVTAAFNLNLLARMNRELEMDFDPSAFRHFATYNPLDGAARSFLVSQRAQRVHSRVLGVSFDFAEGETLYTEQSQKYALAQVEQMAAASDFGVREHVTDARRWYTVSVLQAGDRFET
jgi:L-histidine Nalpha-methyltransferase